MTTPLEGRTVGGLGKGLAIFGVASIGLSLLRLPSLPTNPVDRADAIFFIPLETGVGVVFLLAGLAILRGDRLVRRIGALVAIVAALLAAAAGLLLLRGVPLVGVLTLAGGALVFGSAVVTLMSDRD